MPYKKGHEKLGGRKKGVQNKTPKPVKELISNFTVESWDRFLFEIESLSGIDYVKSYLQLLDYQIPKLQRIEVPQEREHPREIKFSFLEPISINDNVSTFSELPLKKQEEILKKAKIKVKPRPEKTYDKPVSSPRPNEEREYKPKQETVYSPPPPKPEKKHEQMETINVSNFKYQDCIIK